MPEVVLFSTHIMFSSEQRRGQLNNIALPYFTFWYLLSPRNIKILKIRNSYVIAARQGEGSGVVVGFMNLDFYNCQTLSFWSYPLYILPLYVAVQFYAFYSVLISIVIVFPLCVGDNLIAELINFSDFWSGGYSLVNDVSLRLIDWQ